MVHRPNAATACFYEESFIATQTSPLVYLLSMAACELQQWPSSVVVTVGPQSQKYLLSDLQKKSVPTRTQTNHLNFTLQRSLQLWEMAADQNTCYSHKYKAISVHFDELLIQGFFKDQNCLYKIKESTSFKSLLLLK